MKLSIFGGRHKASGAIIAIAEQLFYTGSQFLLTLSMARVLTTSEFGLFALIGSFVTLSNVIHFCVVFEPALVNDPATSVPRMFKPFLETTAISVLCLGVYCILTGSFALAFSGSLYILGYNAYWLLRSVVQVNRAFLLSLLYGLIVITIYAGSLIIGYKHHLSINYLLVIMGTLKALFSGGTLWSYRRRFGLHFRIMAPADNDRAWYVFGVQSFIHQVLVWIILNLPMLYLGYRGLLDQVGAIRVLYTFLLPCQYVFMAVFNYYMPHYVELNQRKESGRVMRFFAWTSLLAGTMACFYALALFLLGSRLSGLLFGEKYHGIHFGVFALVPILLSQISSTRALLKASGRVRGTAIAALFGALVMAVWILIAQPHSYGFAAMSVVAAYAVVLGVMMFEIYREFVRPSERYGAKLEDSCG